MRVAATLALLPLVLLSCASDPYADLPDPLFAAYDGKAVPGAAVLVVQNGEAVHRATYGMADLEGGLAVSAETNFRLASVTKQFTATAILLLVKDGVLGLDDPVDGILSGMPAVADPITVRHLLQHQSGLQDYENLIPDGFQGQVHDADVLELISGTDSLYFPPGTDYRYSNTGYALLALIVEKRSGLTFPDFLATRIFTPLGMEHSLAFVDGLTAVPHRAFGYVVENGQASFRDQSRTSAVLGDGGIYSSLRDLQRWDAALSTDQLLTDSLRTLMFTPGLNGYGFGWRIDTFAGHRRYGHTGSTSGFRNVIHRYPDLGLTVIILTNRAAPDVADLAEQVAARYF
ncbi:MAG: serine hydrolase [Bacteroidetes bacterium]|nr:serine hydrolase [Bacteroidota bacterium]MDA0873641.1 serine hydrolase [Bacteroidota bacterium]